MRKFIVPVAALVLGASAVSVRAQNNAPFDVDLGLGYSRLRIDGPNAKDLDKNDGAAFHAEGMWRTLVPGLRIGFGAEVSGYYDDFHELNDNGDERHRYHALEMVVPELRVAYKIPIDHFFIEPNIGVGAALADYQVGTLHHHHHRDDDNNNDNEFAESDDDSFRINAAVQPGIKIGFASDYHWAVGLEASYLYTHLHFKDGVGGDVNEMYGGAFFRWSF